MTVPVVPEIDEGCRAPQSQSGLLCLLLSKGTLTSFKNPISSMSRQKEVAVMYIVSQKKDRSRALTKGD